MKKIIGIITAVIGIVVIAFNIAAKIKRHFSISIIGGADGSTSIYVAGKLGGVTTAAGMIIGVVVLIIGIVLIRRGARN